MRCSSCGKDVPDIYDFCLQCGFPVSHQPTTALLDSDGQSAYPPGQHEKRSRNVRPLAIMLIVGGLVILVIVLITLRSKSTDTVSTEQAEVDTTQGNNITRSNNPPSRTDNDSGGSPQSTPLLRTTPSSLPQTDNTSIENGPNSPKTTDGSRLVPASFFVPARRYYFTKFNIPAKSMRVVGNFRASGGSGNDIEVMIVDEEGFKNFANKQGTRTYYNSGKLSIGTIDVRLQPGTYYIIFNNNFSLLSNKNVVSEITLKD